MFGCLAVYLNVIMLAMDEEVQPVLEISVPIISSCGVSVLKEYSEKSHQCKNNKNISSFDPNLGMLNTLPDASISYDLNTWNDWNIGPYLSKILPASVEMDKSVLLFGGLNPNSIAENKDHGLKKDIVFGSSIFQYKLDTGVLHYFGTMIEPRCYHCCTLINQYVYITGGCSLLKRKHGEMVALSSTDRLDLVTVRWQRCSNMNTPRAEHAAVAYKKNVYVFGGKNRHENLLSSVEKYDPEQDLWTELTLLPKPTTGLCAVVGHDQIWILGGVNATSSHPPSTNLSSSVFVLDFQTKRWIQKRSLPYPCAYASCIMDGMSIWLIGGCTLLEGADKYGLVSCSSVLRQALCSENHKWISVASLWHARHSVAAIVNDGIIYVLGGIESCLCKASNKVECIDANKNMVTKIASLPFAVAGFGSVLISESIKGFIDSLRTNQENIVNETSKHWHDVGVQIASSKHSRNGIRRVQSFDSLTKAPQFVPEHSHEPPLGFESDQLNYRKPFEPARLRGLFNTPCCPTKTYSSALGQVAASPTYSSLDKQIFLKAGQCFQNFGHRKPKNRVSMEIFLDPAEKKTSFLQSKWLEYYGSPPTGTNSETSRTKLHKVCSADSFMSGRTFSDFEELSLASSKASQCRLKSLCKTNIAGFLSDKTERHKQDNVFGKDSLLSLEENSTKILLSEDSSPVILVAGGEDESDKTNSRYILAYDCTRNEWKNAGYLPGYYAFHAAVYLNNRFYIIGGFTSENGEFHSVTSKTICYDFTREMWLKMSNLCVPRACHSAVIVDNQIFVIGGQDQRGQILASVEVYDQSSDTWRECNPVPFPVYGAAVIFQDGLIHLYGGVVRDETGTEKDEHISSFSTFYDPLSNSWSVGPDMQIPLAFSGVSSFQGSVWLFGGLTDRGKIVSSKDIFTVTKMGLKKQCKLSIARQCSVTVSLESKVYVIGGEVRDLEEEVDVCEVVDLFEKTVHLISPIPIKATGKAGGMINAFYFKHSKA